MKHIKLFENFDTKSIDDICVRYNINDYTINDDGSIDVEGDVALANKGLDKLPLKFRKVTGYFGCCENKFTSLEGCPEYVGGDFDCEDNLLTNLIGSPNYIGGSFTCRYNMLTSLEGSPNHVGSYFEIRNNGIKSLKGLNTNIGTKLYADYKLKIIYDILKDDLECIDNFYEFHILDNLEYEKPTLNLKRLNKFIDLYDLNELSEDNLSDIKKYYNVI